MEPHYRKRRISQACLLSLSIISTSAPAQVVTLEWQTSMGGTLYDKGRQVQRTSDGGFVMIGHVASDDGDVTGYHGGADDIWVVRMDSAGSMVWQKCRGGANTDLGYAVRQTDDGGYIITGWTQSNNGNVTGNHGGIDFWVAKMAANGPVQWQRALGGSAADIPEDVIQTSDGGFLVIGTTTSTDGEVVGNHGGSDAWLTKLDSLGDVQWQHAYGGSSGDGLNSVIQTSDGGYLLAGNTNSTDGDVLSCPGGGHAWLMKLDDAGNIQWQRCMGASTGFNALDTAAGGGFIGVGYAYGNDADLSGWHEGYLIDDIPNADAWMVKLDGSGAIEWQRCFGGSGPDEFFAVKQTPTGSFIADGSTESNNGDVAPISASQDGWLVEVNSAGSLLWQRPVGGGGYDDVHGLALTSGGGVVVSGTSTSNDGDVSGNHGAGDLWVAMYSRHFNTIQGLLFCDLNSNGMHDGGEPVIPYRRVTSTGTGEFAWSETNGSYELAVAGPGTFSVAPDALPYYTSVPASRSISFPDVLQTSTGNDFALQPSTAANDLSVLLTSIIAFRPGFLARYDLQYNNVGTTSLAPTVVFHPDPGFIYTSASVTPSSITADSIVWVFPSTQPFEGGTIEILGTVDAGVPVGTIMTSTATISPVAGDADIANNSDISTGTVQASFDPNGIIVDRASLYPADLFDPPSLDYLIRFQNTGSAPAVNVRIEDPVPAELELGSFEFEAASHPVSIEYDALLGALVFHFDNIQLPDSNADEAASHGFVRYRIKPIPTLMPGDSVFNQASIYFDYNQPVLTNTAHTVVETSTVIASLSMGDGFSLFPNPATGTVMMVTTSPLTGAELLITDATGREVLRTEMSGRAHTLHVDDLPRGIYVVKLRTAKDARTQRLVLE